MQSLITEIHAFITKLYLKANIKIKNFLGYYYNNSFLQVMNRLRKIIVKNFMDFYVDLKVVIKILN